MKEHIRQINKDAEFYTAEHCYINELSNCDDDPDVSIAQARVLAGVTTRWHYLNEITERYVIIEGCGLVEVGNSVAQQVGPGDVVIIPPQCNQRITNTGVSDLVFLAICNPRFKLEAYNDSEDDLQPY